MTLLQETICCILLFPSPYDSTDLLPTTTNQNANQVATQQPIEPEKDEINVAVLKLILSVLEESPTAWYE